jgi:hypothetical protein
MNTVKLIRRKGVMVSTPEPGAKPQPATGTVNYDEESNRFSKAMSDSDRARFGAHIKGLTESLPGCYFCVSVDEDEETGTQRLMVRCLDDRRSVERSRDLARVLPALGIPSHELLVIS